MLWLDDAWRSLSLTQPPAAPNLLLAAGSPVGCSLHTLPFSNSVATMTFTKSIGLACAPLLVLLALSSTAVAAAQELPATASADVVDYPDRGEYAHSYRIRENYDRFTDSLTVQMNLSIGGGTGRVGRFLSRIAHRAGVSRTNLELTAAGEGDPFREPPAIAQVTIERDYSIEYGEDGLLEAEPLRLITDDGQRYSFETRLTGRERTTTDEDIEEQREGERQAGIPTEEHLILVFYEDRFTADVPTTVLISLASASQIDGRIGDREFVLGEEEIQALRDYVSRLAPDPSYGPVGARVLDERAAEEISRLRAVAEEAAPEDDGGDKPLSGRSSERDLACQGPSRGLTPAAPTRPCRVS
jgi:hypothetical protein